MARMAKYAGTLKKLDVRVENDIFSDSKLVAFEIEVVIPAEQLLRVEEVARLAGEQVTETLTKMFRVERNVENPREGLKPGKRKLVLDL